MAATKHHFVPRSIIGQFLAAGLDIYDKEKRESYPLSLNNFAVSRGLYGNTDLFGDRRIELIEYRGTRAIRRLLNHDGDAQQLLASEKSEIKRYLFLQLIRTRKWIAVINKYFSQYDPRPAIEIKSSLDFGKIFFSAIRQLSDAEDDFSFFVIEANHPELFWLGDHPCVIFDPYNDMFPYFTGLYQKNWVTALPISPHQAIILVYGNWRERVKRTLKKLTRGMFFGMSTHRLWFCDEHVPLAPLELNKFLQSGKRAGTDFEIHNINVAQAKAAYRQIALPQSHKNRLLQLFDISPESAKAIDLGRFQLNNLPGRNFIDKDITIPLRYENG